MFISYLDNGKFRKRNHQDFFVLRKSINIHRETFWNFKLDIVIELLHELGRNIISDKALCAEPGIAYLALWLKRANLQRICSLNYIDKTFYEQFTQTEQGFELCAQPRGIVCHWVATNVPTLAFFSLVQAILSKNGSIVKVADANRDILLKLLKKLNETKIKIDKKVYLGKDIVRSIAVVSFSSDDKVTNEKFSLAADAKVVWGSASAVNDVRALPQREHCETIIFGPKYSFGVFAKDYIESGHFKKALGNVARDVAVFNQMACSSPHVFFFEKSKYSIYEIGEMLHEEFKKLPAHLLSHQTSENIAATIINKRAVHLLDNGKFSIASEDLRWTILINNDLSLEEPVQGKCIFIKEVKHINQVVDLITRKIQVVSAAILNSQKRKEFARQATFKGVDRIVSPGKMHDFDLPWDGILTLNRLVRWVILKNQENDNA